MRYEKLESVFLILIKLLTFMTVFILGIIVVFILKESTSFFAEENIFTFIFSTKWKPLSHTSRFGLLHMILATIYTSFVAVAIATPIGVGCSVFLSVYVNKKMKIRILPIIDLLAGIPSVIYGFWGLKVVVKFFEIKLHKATGESILAAGIILAIMVLPFIVSTVETTMTKVVNENKLAVKALGIKRWYFILEIILPSSIKGILASLILALGRALGETMAVMMVVGNTPLLPKLFSRGETIAGLMALEMGGAEIGSKHYHSLFAAGFILILMIVLIHFIVRKIDEKII